MVGILRGSKVGCGLVEEFGEVYFVYDGEFWKVFI